MMLLNGLALAGLAGLASSAATHEQAEVYILSSKHAASSSSSSLATPSLPRQLARDILFQRVTGDLQLKDLSSTIVGDRILSYFDQYGRSPRPLFGASSEDVSPSQLVVLLEGVTEDNARTLRGGLQKEDFAPAFKIEDAPSTKANKHLVDVEFAAGGVSGSCNVAAAINPYDSCWKGMSLVVKYDAAKDPEALQALVDSVPALSKSVSSNNLEATLILLPESSRASKHSYWTTDAPNDLRRRFSDESPMSDAKVDKVTVSPGSGGVDLGFTPGAAAKGDKMNLGCFTSQNSCVTATSNCTGHGTCVDKFAVPGQETREGDKQCFVCSCLSTKKFPDKENSKHVHWGGAYCQKIDVSSPFWLIATTTVVLVGLVTGCIAMLFSIGEEKLPGVIGAGVSRSK
ncbi:arsenate reductase [Diaporthe eres]|uniref:Vacuolar sorting protein Vps3844 C-terminal domain-containing protein n=1 Tax=Diaporthe vaccinii TaxID=105482 RepID=A0ABR4DZ99_9PEZI|nr:arsenate reductase [Diaporthe eres]